MGVSPAWEVPEGTASSHVGQSHHSPNAVSRPAAVHAFPHGLRGATSPVCLSTLGNGSGRGTLLGSGLPTAALSAGMF